MNRGHLLSALLLASSTLACSVSHDDAAPRLGHREQALLTPYAGTARFRRFVAEPTARYATSLAEHADGMVLFGGHATKVLGDTWVWDGARWRERLPTTSPPAREGGAFASLGDQAILFGGVDATLTKALDDTWAWDGLDWRSVAPAKHPPGLVYGSLVRAGAKLVLVGGKNPGSDATWTFDGADWTELTLTPRPAYPPSGQGIVAATFGGLAFCVFSGETWTFDGSTWTNRSGAAGTPTTVGALGTVDGKLVLVGAGKVWEWSGATWTSRAAPPVPDDLGGVGQYSLATYRDGIHVFGGRTIAGNRDQHFRFDKTGWTRPLNRAKPPPRGLASLASSGDRVVLFGGWDGSILGDTWEFDGKAWTEKSPAASPTPRASAAFADGGDVALLFGGLEADAVSNETWTWDHTNWKQLTGGVRPVADPNARLARVGATDVLLAGSTAYTFGASGWSAHPGKTPNRLGTVLTGEDWSVFTSYQDQGLLIVSEVGKMYAYGASNTFAPVAATGIEGIGGTKVERPLLADAAIDLGRFALLLGHRIDAAATEPWLWDGKQWAPLAVEGLPPLTRTVAARLGSEVAVFGGFDDRANPSSETWLLHVALARGVECKAADDCDTGFCAQGVCCNTACAGTTESCSQPETRGTCAPVLAVCTTPTTLRSGDGSEKSCAPFLCVAGACLQKCSTTADCIGGKVCDTASTACVDPPAPEADPGCAVSSPRVAKGSPGLPPSTLPPLALLGALALLRRRAPARPRSTGRCDRRLSDQPTGSVDPLIR